MEMHRLAHLLWNSDAPSAEFGKAKSVELSWWSLWAIIFKWKHLFILLSDTTESLQRRCWDRFQGHQVSQKSNNCDREALLYIHRARRTHDVLVTATQYYIHSIQALKLLYSMPPPYLKAFRALLVAAPTENIIWIQLMNMYTVCMVVTHLYPSSDETGKTMLRTGQVSRVRSLLWMMLGCPIIH